MEVPSALEDTNRDQIQQESVTHRYHAESFQRYMKTDELFEDLLAFRKNVVLIFHCPVTSAFDSEEAKSKKALIRERCRKIKALGPDGVLSWASTFAPQLWEPGSMANELFNQFLQNMEPSKGYICSAGVYDMLRALRTEELLQDSEEYQHFLKGSSY